jgi:FlaA1/EpsC-like NDP-sugar epimerase
MKDVVMEFIKSTDNMKDLMILTEIGKGSSTTQALLANIAGLSVAMTNSYIKKLCNNNFLAMHGNNKRKVYKLTAEGVEYKQFLLISFMAELIQLSTSVSEQIKQMLLPLVKDGEKKIFFYGAGETGQVCVKVATEIKQMKVIGFIDDNAELHDKLILGYRVTPLISALQQPFDKIVISTFTNKNAIIKKLSQVNNDRIIMLSDLDTKIWINKKKINGESFYDKP